MPGRGGAFAYQGVSTRGDANAWSLQGEGLALIYTLGMGVPSSRSPVIHKMARLERGPQFVGSHCLEHLSSGWWGPTASHERLLASLTLAVLSG